MEHIFKSKKKAQGAIEFIIIFSAFLLFFVAFFSVIKVNIEKKNLEKERLIAQSIALDVQYELNLAAESSEGYYRVFNVPNNILGKDYQINISDNRVFVFIGKFGISYRVLPVNGSINKGVNVITKQNENVFLN